MGYNQAFPCFHGENYKPQIGLTKREHFASLFMQALITSYENNKDKGYFLFDINDAIPRAALMYAESLIKELNKE